VQTFYPLISLIHRHRIALLYTSLTFFSGVAIVYILDAIVHYINPDHHDDIDIRGKNLESIASMSSAAAVETACFI